MSLRMSIALIFSPVCYGWDEQKSIGTTLQLAVIEKSVQDIHLKVNVAWSELLFVMHFVKQNCNSDHMALCKGILLWYFVMENVKLNMIFCNGKM